MSLETLSENRSHGGTQGVYRHPSAATHTDMVFSVFVPDHPAGGETACAVVSVGADLHPRQCHRERRVSRRLRDAGIIFVAPDTSPRGEDVPDDPDGLWDFGQGAGFYLDAIQEPWNRHFNMASYLIDELPALLAEHFPVDPERQGICGHSMGGHGALTLALKHPGRFRSVSAFAPIVAPRQVPWGRKALRHYLGPDTEAWRAHDSVALIEDGARLDELLVDIGDGDPFLEKELRPELAREGVRRRRHSADAAPPAGLRP